MCLNVHLALNQHLRMPTTCYPLMIFQPSKLCRFYHARVASCGQSRQYTDRTPGPVKLDLPQSQILLRSFRQLHTVSVVPLKRIQ